jgi:predicted ATPase/DNA-binding SARP family transcriptional activator
MARLSLSLLGSMQFLLDGRAVSGFAYNKARALLAYLAVEAERPHQRDVIVGLLWPELPDTAARTNLRQALANLREAIGDATATPPFLLITRDAIQFNPTSDYELDVSAFTALLAACETHTHRHPHRCRSCAARIEQALAHYRGDFLAEFGVGDSAPFEEWQLRQRERLHEQALAALAHIADYHERRGDDELARRYCQRQIALEPWREEAHRQLMRLLARSGQRSAALAQYETCRRALGRDLGIEPEANTTLLYEQIRDHELRIENGELRRIRAQNSFSILHNFPAQTTSLIGREVELAELGSLLENPACRLITIVGSGGIGKTRLALAAAAEHAEIFTDGAVFVSLAAISSIQFVAPTILSVLDIPLQGQDNPSDQLLNYLRGKELLLVLDNFEHLLAPDLREDEGAIALLTNVLQRAPGVTLLVTSRERLALLDEWLFDLAGLSYPIGEPIEGAESYDAVRLFVQRAGQVRRQFALAEGETRAVARICQLVEGLPLAIELAAAALRTRSSVVVAAAIENNLSALATNLRAVPERHRSVSATFEHSWRMLSDEERQVFPRLSVFRGGFEEEAAVQVAVASPQILARLVDKSLLRWDGAARYDMHELVRQYAGEKLQEAQAATDARKRHAACFLALAQTTEPKLRGPQQEVWLERLEIEHNNLRTALRWAIDSREVEMGLQLAGALGWFWYAHDHSAEGRRWLAHLLTLAASYSAAADTQVKALNAAGALTLQAKDFASAQALLGASLTLAQEIGDGMGLAWSLHMHGLMAYNLGDYAQAVVRAEQSLMWYRSLEDSWGIAASLLNLGNVMSSQGRYEQAAAHYTESLTIWQEAGDKRGMAFVFGRQAAMARHQADYERANVLLQKCILLFRELKERSGIAWSSCLLGRVCQHQSDYEQAAVLLSESLRLHRELDDTPGMAAGLVGLAEVACSSGQPERAATLLGAEAALRETLGYQTWPTIRADYEHIVATVRAQLDEATFAAAWAEGRAMTLEQAIAYALGGLELTADAVGSHSAAG